jgi:uncharacterized membrane protein YedE/YeeE
MLPDYWFGLAGGILIGASSLFVMALTGKIPGISGVFGRLFAPQTNDRSWRLIFLGGLIVGAGVAFVLLPHAKEFRASGLVNFLIAGILVGFGTRISGGCTSGHGVCGVGRGQLDSIVATMTFVTVGMITVGILRHLVF